jgi:hypothetical protein
VSVVHPDLLQDLQEAEKTVRINGAGGFQFETSAKGYLHEFPVHASKQTTVNILSFGDIEDELLRTSSFPSYNEAVHLVEDGNITGLPGLTAEDVRRAYELYAQHPAYLRGKTVKKKTGRAIVDDDLVLDEKKQMLYTDIMHLDGEKFLVFSDRMRTVTAHDTMPYRERDTECARTYVARAVGTAAKPWVYSYYRAYGSAECVPYVGRAIPRSGHSHRRGG